MPHIVNTGWPRWFATSFVVAFLAALAFSYGTYDPIPPRVNVRWVESLTRAQRVALETAYHLSDPESTDARTWSYGLLDTSTENIQRLVQDRAAEDTYLIDRTTFTLTDPPPGPLVILTRFSARSALVGFAVALLVAAGVFLERRTRSRRQAFLAARRAAAPDVGPPLGLGEGAARSFVFLAGASYFYILMEWLFFATKPSFMTQLPRWEVVTIPLTTPLALIALGLPVWFAAFVLFAVMRRVRLLASLSGRILFVVPAVIIAAAILLLLDNFTYVLFGLNLGKAEGAARYVYAVLFSGVLIVLAWRFEQRSRLVFWRRHPRAPFVVSGVLIGLGLAVAAGQAWSSPPPAGPPAPPAPEHLPNVLILSTDGLDASHMSAYGYARDTTPFIRQLLPELLVSENHLSNNDKTTGSLATLLTGKLSTTTRVFNSQSALAGDDVLQHLPGVLRAWGYASVEIGLRFFADAYDINLRQAFDVGTGPRRESASLFEPLRPRLMSEVYFLDLLQDRIVSRLRHVFGLAEYVDPSFWENWNEATMMDDAPRIRELQAFLRTAPRPFFANVHLLGTHGQHFHPRRQHFSVGQDQPDPWMTDFYDDAILEFDADVAEVLAFLKESGDYDDTLIILNTDHGSQWTIDHRLPLLMRFPHQDHRGRIAWNTQRVDIAPTIVDYLGGSIPEWMSGRSLIGPAPESERPIFSFWSTSAGPGGDRPPFYDLRAVQVAMGDRLYRLDLESHQMQLRRLSGHTAPLAQAALPSAAKIRADIVQHLKAHGYDVSSLSAP